MSSFTTTHGRPQGRFDGMQDFGGTDRSSAPPQSPVHPPARTRMTLEQAWREADEQFFASTKRHLMSTGPDDKAGVLQTWQAKYERDESSESTRRFNQMKNVLQTVLDGIEVIGAFAAQAASTVFAPASMCFNALAFLIDAPRQIKKVYDGLKDLFEEVSDFLVKFKIFKRIDDDMTLDEDLLMNTNHVLISFVRICALSIRLLEGSKILTAAKVIFLKNDSGVAAELATFRRLTQSQNMLTGTVTLEHVLRSEQGVKAILASSDDMQAKLKSLNAARMDEQTKSLDKQRLMVLQRKLFSQAELSSVGIKTSPLLATAPLPQTLSKLKASSEYSEWMGTADLEAKALMLFGSSGTGKSAVIDCLKEELEEQQREASEAGPATYVCYHRFEPTEQQVERTKAALSETYALRSVAFQLASQSNSHARTLERYLQPYSNVYNVESLNKLWEKLKIDQFPVPVRGSTLTLLFDDVEHSVTGSFKELLHHFLGGGRRHKSDSSQTIVIRILFASTSKNVGRAVPMLRMEDLNSSLLDTFISNEMKRLGVFQDTDERSLVQKLMVETKLPPNSAGNFNVAKQKLGMVRDAIDKDAPDHQLSIILASDVVSDEDHDSKQTINELESISTPQQIEQLNTLLMWMVYMKRDREFLFTITELEAALYLSLEKRTLEPVVKKLQKRFAKVFFRADNTSFEASFGVREPILHFLSQNEDHQPQSSSTYEPLFSLAISIQGAPEEDIRRFIWQLNEQMVSGNFNFQKPETTLNRPRIRLNKLQAHLTITRLCLKLLNEESQQNTKGLRVYARDYLPCHLAELHNMVDLISLEDREALTQSLIRYLSDPYHVANDEGSFGMGIYWLLPEFVDSIIFWISDPTILNRLPSREKRWVRQALNPTHKLSFMNDMALAVARKWSGLNHRKLQIEVFPLWRFYQMYEWLMRFLNNGNDSAMETDSDRYIADEPFKRAKKVVDWAEGRIGKMDSARYSMLMAGALYCEDDFHTAITYFRQCPAGSPQHWRALHGICFCYGRLDDDEARLTSLKELVDALTKQKENGNLDAEDLKEYVEILKERAAACKAADQPDEAIKLYKEILKENSSNDDIRWAVVWVLCATDRCEETLTLLDDWFKNPDDHGGQGPAESLVAATERAGYYSRLHRSVESVRNEQPRKPLFNILQKAGQLSKTRLSHKYVEVLFSQGIIAIASSFTDLHHQGIGILENFVQLSMPPGAETTDLWTNLLLLACGGLIKYKFDEFLKDGAWHSDRSNANIAESIAKFKSYMTLVIQASPDYPTIKLIDSPLSYIASAYSACDRQHLARQQFANAMIDYLDILEDDNPHNDVPAINDIIRIFCVTGDKDDAFIAWSLLDRQRPSWLDFTCTNCKRKPWSHEKPGFWFCCYCSTEGLCNSCYTSKILQNDKWTTYRCNPAHKRIHLHHWDYIEEERESNKVLMDFKIVIDEAGREKRVGGRVADISEWLNQIRAKWNLPSSSAVASASV